MWNVENLYMADGQWFEEIVDRKADKLINFFDLFMENLALVSIFRVEIDTIQVLSYCEKTVFEPELYRSCRFYWFVKIVAIYCWHEANPN